jgi:hypothetical protein
MNAKKQILRMVMRYGFRCTAKREERSNRNETIKPLIWTYTFTNKKI